MPGSELYSLLALSERSFALLLPKSEEGVVVSATTPTYLPVQYDVFLMVVQKVELTDCKLWGQIRTSETLLHLHPSFRTTY
jgi:hypothetical protein